MLKKIHQFFHNHYHLKYHGIYKHAKQLFIFDLFLLLTAIVIFFSGLYFLFWRPNIKEQIILNAQIEKNIRSGDETKITITYTNNSKDSISSPTLAIRLPEGFILNREKTPEKILSENSTFSLPEIKAGGQGTIELYGTVWVEPNREQKITLILSYKQENKKQTEQKITSIPFTLSESILNGELEFASSSLPGQTIPFSYSLTNLSDKTLDSIAIRSEKSELLPNGYIKIISLLPKETKTVTGTLISPNEAQKNKITILSEIEISGQKILLNSKEHTLQTTYPNLHVEIKNDSSQSYVEPNSQIPISISWKNDSAFTISDLKLKISSTPDIIDWKKTFGQQVKIDKTNVVLDRSNRTIFTSVKPEGGEVFSVPLYIKPIFDLSPSERISLSITPNLEGEINELNQQTFTIPGKKLEIPLASKVSIKTEVRYFTPEGEQVGIGPLPPKINETTKYWVWVTINNTSNEIKNVEFKAMLPKNIIFTNKQSTSIGEPIVSQGDSITWSHPELPAHSTTNLYFELAATPTEEQKNQIITLLEKIELSATDAFVNKQTILNIDKVENLLQKNDRGVRFGAKVVTN